jgi:phenylpropionate dioxygenase-like ring-hydroxylating dioxygenase large terminal subunit
MPGAADYDLITRCGPGTLLGDLMRQYWIPVARSDELPEPDCPPVRIRVLNENLIAFRTTSGQVGLIEDGCPHRGASLFFGRNEENGIRCAYHGWKFDITGQCVDMMNEPPETSFARRVRAVAYPTQERASCVWAYLGPRQTPPPLPDLEANLALDGVQRVNLCLNAYNWLQAMENNIDTAHNVILHHGTITPEAASAPDYRNPIMKYMVSSRAARFDVRDTDFGVSYGASRPAEAGTTYWRTMHWLYPFYTMSPTFELGTRNEVVATVPVDDFHNMQFTFNRALGDRASQRQFGGDDTLPNTTDWLGRFRNALDPATDFGLDRDLQRRAPPDSTGWSGIPGGVPAQDEAMKWSQGRADRSGIVDRSREHLGSTDAAIIRVRLRLLEAAQALRERGSPPPAVDAPEVYRQRSGWLFLPQGVDYWEGSRDLRESFQGVAAQPMAR